VKKKPANKIFFQDFDENEIAEVLGYADVVSYRNDSYIFKRGDESDAFYIVSSGELEVFSYEKGEKVVIALIKRGSIVGEIGFLDGQERSASARVKSDVIALKITRDVFNRMEETDITLAIKLIREVESILADRLRHSDNLLVDYQTVKIDEKFMSNVDNTVRHTI
jgi:CRP-like cAMP-binding protein